MPRSDSFTLESLTGVVRSKLIGGGTQEVLLEFTNAELVIDQRYVDNLIGPDIYSSHSYTTAKINLHSRADGVQYIMKVVPPVAKAEPPVWLDYEELRTIAAIVNNFNGTLGVHGKHITPGDTPLFDANGDEVGQVVFEDGRYVFSPGAKRA